MNDEQIEQQLRHYYAVNRLKLPSPSRLCKQVQDMKRQLGLTRPRGDHRDPTGHEVFTREDQTNLWKVAHPAGFMAPNLSNRLDRQEAS